MKQLFTIFLSFCLYGISYSQTDSVEIEYSDKVKVKSAHFKNILTTGEKGFYTIGTNDKTIGYNKPGASFYLRKYSTGNFEMQQEWEIPAINHKNAKAYYAGSVYNEKGFHLLLEAYDDRIKVRYLLHVAIDKNGNYSEPRELLAIKSKTKFSRKFSIKHSKDYSKCALFFGTDEGTTDQAPMLFVFDEYFELKWKTVARTGLNDESVFRLVQMEVTNSGNILALGYRKTVKFEDGKVNMSEKDALVLYNGKEDPIVFDFADIEENVYSLSMFQDEGDALVLLGTYCEAGSNRPIGNVFMRFSLEDLENEVQSFQRFGSNLIGRLPSMDHSTGKDIKERIENQLGSTKGGGRDGLKFVRYTNIATWPDGSYTAIAQRRYTRNYAGDPPRPAFYYYEDYVVVNMNANGKITSSRAIPYESFIAASSNELGGHYFHQGSDKVYVIFTSHISNVERINTDQDAYSLGARGLGSIVMEINKDSEVRCTNARTYQGLSYTMLSQDFYAKLSENKCLAIYSVVTDNKIEFAEIEFP